MKTWRLLEEGFYEVEGRRVPRVSNPLDLFSSKFLNGWYSKEGTKKAREVLSLIPSDVADRAIQSLPQDFLDSAFEKSDKYARVGSIVHKLIEQDLLGKKTNVKKAVEELSLPYSSYARNSFANYRRWKKEQKSIQVIRTEMVVYSWKHDYAGTLDAILRVNGKIGLYDWKTGSKRKQAELQLSAYKRCIHEMNKGLRIQELVVIHFDREKKFKAKRDVVKFERKKYKKNIKVFVNLLQAWKWYHVKANVN